MCGRDWSSDVCSSDLCDLDSCYHGEILQHYRKTEVEVEILLTTQYSGVESLPKNLKLVIKNLFALVEWVSRAYRTNSW